MNWKDVALVATVLVLVVVIGYALMVAVLTFLGGGRA